MGFRGLAVLCSVIVVVAGCPASPPGPVDDDPGCTRASDCPIRACEDARCIEGECRWVVDATDVDGDGADCFAEPLDCDPFDAVVSPFQIEQCDNGVDDDCDGVVDECDDLVECRDGWCLDRGVANVSDDVQGSRVVVIGAAEGDEGADAGLRLWAHRRPVPAVFGSHRVTSAPLWQREAPGRWAPAAVETGDIDVDSLGAVGRDDVWLLGLSTSRHLKDGVVVAEIEAFAYASCVVDDVVRVLTYPAQIVPLGVGGITGDGVTVADPDELFDARLPALHCPGGDALWVANEVAAWRLVGGRFVEVPELEGIAVIGLDDDGTVVAVDDALHAVRAGPDGVTAISIADAELVLADRISTFVPDDTFGGQRPRALRDGALVPLPLPFDAPVLQALTTSTGRHVLLLDDGSVLVRDR